LKMGGEVNFNLLKFMVSGYHSLIQSAIFFILLVIIASAAANLLFSFAGEKRMLFLKMAFLSLFLFLLCYADKETILHLLPHNLMI
jgi:hypothetical protein